MSGKDSEPGQTRRGFGAILGGLAATAILGTTVVANAEEGPAPDARAADQDTAQPDLTDVRRIEKKDITALAAELDALKLPDNQRALLLALISVATDTIQRSRADDSISPLVSTVQTKGVRLGVVSSHQPRTVRDQFRTAFIAGAIEENPLSDHGEVIIYP
jgi:hypothetical protein